MNKRSETQDNVSDSKLLFSFSPDLKVHEIMRLLHAAKLEALPRRGIYEIRKRGSK